LEGVGLRVEALHRNADVPRREKDPGRGRSARVRLAGWVLIERMFDLSAVLVLCILGVVYMVFAGGVALAGGKGLPPWLLLSCPPLLAVALGVPLLIRFRPAGLWRMLTRILPGKAKELAEVRLTGRQFGGFFLVSLLSEIISVLTVYFCLRAYTQIDLLTACAVAPLVMLHNVIPATPGGFGVREALAVAIMVDLLALPGLTAPQVLAAYLTNPIMVLVIPGAVGIVAAWLAGMMRSLDAEAAP
ncbi:hypothetical protein LCGC14_3006950, partial [marine sediment metagenome]